jgi:hypothetical protein
MRQQFIEQRTQHVLRLVDLDSRLQVERVFTIIYREGRLSFYHTNHLRHGSSSFMYLDYLILGIADDRKQCKEQQQRQISLPQ